MENTAKGWGQRHESAPSYPWPSLFESVHDRIDAELANNSV